MTLENMDQVAFSIAHKTIMHNGEEYIAYLVPIQGTHQDEQWISNFNIGDGKNHFGFTQATNKVENKLNEVKKRYSRYDSDHTLILTTGHSRGAAVANILAARLNNRGTEFKTGNVFCYTFACPTVTQEKYDKEKYTDYHNIYNFNNPGDGVPQVPLKEWGYFRHGVTFNLSLNNEIFDQFKRRYKNESGKEYEGQRNTDGFQDTLRAVLGDDQDVKSSFLLHFALDYAGWFMMDQTQKDEISIVDIANLAKSQTTGEVSTAEAMFISAVNLYALTNDSAEAFSNITGFCDELEIIKQEIHQMEEEAKEYILNYWPQYYNMLFKDEEESLTLEEAIDSLIDSDEFKFMKNVPFFREKINALENLLLVIGKEIHEHNMFTYNAWIDTMFWGNEGWCGDYYRTSNAYGNFERALTTEPEKTEENGQIYYTYDTYYITPGSSIGSGCFEYCNFTDNTEITIPEGVKYISEYAFSSSNITKLVVPDSVDYLGANMLYDCENLGEVTLPFAGNNRYENENCVVGVGQSLSTGKSPESFLNICSAVYYKHYSDYPYRLHKVTITGGKTIPDSYFGNFRTISEVELADSITEIGNFAFNYCNLSEIHLPSNLKYVGKYAFERCRLSCDLIFPEGMEYIGEYAFSRNALTENNKIYVPGTVKEIGARAFEYVGENIGSIIIDNGVGKVGYGILNNIRSIDTLSLPYIGNTLDSFGDDFTYFNMYSYLDFAPYIHKLYITGGKIIPYYALNGYSIPVVGEIFISEPVEVIEDWAFGRNHVAIVHLPTSIKKIGSNAFSYYSYPVIEYRGTQEEWNAVEADSYLSENSVTFKPFVRNISGFDYCQAYENEDISFNITVSDNTNCEQIEYQWQYIPLSDYYSEADNWIDFGSDAKIENNFNDNSGMSNCSIVYTMNDKYDGAVVRCIISNQYGSVIQEFDYINLIQHPEITLQPEPQTVKKYQQVTLTADYIGKGSNCQWQYSEDGYWRNCYYANDKEYTFEQQDWYGDRYYRLKVYNDREEIYTDPVLVSVKNDLIITSQPTALSVLSGEHAYFTFDAEGDELEYTWYYKTPDSSVFVESPDYKWNYFAMQAGAENNGTKVYCIVKDRYGVSKMTDTVSLTVTGLEVKITEQPSNVSVSAGEKANFSLIASGNGLKYTWYYKLPSSKTYKKYADNMTNVFEMSTSKSKNGTKVYCVVTDSTGKTVKSDTVTLTVS